MTAESGTLVFLGSKLEYLIQPVAGRGRHPVVIVLHGGASNDKIVWTETSLPTLGARNGFIVVAPNASINHHWNDGRGIVGSGKPSTADDVGYLKALIAKVVRDGNADASSIFMIGVSIGGFMTMRFACEAGRLLRAGGNVISNIPARQAAACRIGKPLPWVSINGERDPIVPFNGVAPGRMKRGRPQVQLESADQTFAFFADRAGCSAGVRVVVLSDIDPRDGSIAQKGVRSGCARGKTSTQYVMHGAGHTWPGLLMDPRRARLRGGVNEDVDSGSAIWAHFSQTLR